MGLKGQNMDLAILIHAVPSSRTRRALPPRLLISSWRGV